MPRNPALRPALRRARLAALAAALLLASGCVGLFRRTPPPQYGFQRLVWEATRVLDVEEPTPVYYRQRARLEVMGRELDEALVFIINNPRAKDPVRINAVTLLADRSGPNAALQLRTVLASSRLEQLREAAAAGLQRFAADSPFVKEALRAALQDPSSGVRLAALQGMDVEDVAFVRARLRREENGQVRTVARQLVTLFEARGASLEADERGDLRTAGADSVPRIVFHPLTRDPVFRTMTGALWVEVPGQSLLPIATTVPVVNDVVPAFFDPQRKAVVYEAEGQVQIRELASGASRMVGPGLAPRPVPFTDRFVYLREVPNSRRTSAGITTISYVVMRASFGGGAAEAIGTLQAASRPDRWGGDTPVRAMVVEEGHEGFNLGGEGITPFVLPGPNERPDTPRP
ncbi:MAG TPA: HEAT repeat domain-containing protein [Longimicrobium sp.]|nr:HEAT repeat domain-containing protein [Longimicrobium sp.]